MFYFCSGTSENSFKEQRKSMFCLFFCFNIDQWEIYHCCSFVQQYSNIATVYTKPVLFKALTPSKRCRSRTLDFWVKVGFEVQSLFVWVWVYFLRMLILRDCRSCCHTSIKTNRLAFAVRSVTQQLSNKMNSGGKKLPEVLLKIYQPVFLILLQVQNNIADPQEVPSTMPTNVSFFLLLGRI